MLNEFIGSFKSTSLSTIDENNNPFSSYAPFIKYKNSYYIFISDMAKHTKNIKSTKKVSLFFIEDEEKCTNIFARKRATLQCDAKIIDRKNADFEEIINIFEETHGDTIQMLKGMLDFHLFELNPFYGEAVFGFGKAYNIEGENFDELVQRKGQMGHKKS